MHPSRKSVFNMPFAVKAFRKHIKDWRNIGGLIYATPKQLPLNYLVFRQKPLGFFETALSITAIYEAVKGENMNNALEDLYRRLKGMECYLEWRSLLPRKGVFKENVFLKELRLRVNDLQISGELAKLLNEDREVMRLVEKIRPDSLTIGLHSIPASYESLLVSGASLIDVVEDFYKKPIGITWLITLDTPFSQGLGVHKKAEEIVHLLHSILRIINSVMKQVNSILDDIK